MSVRALACIKQQQKTIVRSLRKKQQLINKLIKEQRGEKFSGQKCRVTLHKQKSDFCQEQVNE
jgi:hypothetical protein